MTAPNRFLYLSVLKIIDLLLIVSALGVTLTLFYAPHNQLNFVLHFFSDRIKVINALLGGLLLFVSHFAFSIQGLYLPNRWRSFSEEMWGAVRTVLVVALALSLASWIGHWPTINPITVGTFIVISLAFYGSVRFVFGVVLGWFRRAGRNTKNLLIIGGGIRSRQFARQVVNRRELGFKLTGYLDSDASYSSAPLAGAPWLGPVEDLPSLLAEKVIDEVVVALPIKSRYAQMQYVIKLLSEQGIPAHVLTDFFDDLVGYRPGELQGIPLVTLHSTPLTDWRTEIKRALDLVAAALILIAVAPIMALIALAIKLDSRGPILFVQERMGYKKRRFRLYKFRTMSIDAEARIKDLEHLNEKDGPIFKIRNDPRITRVGRFLRKTSLDELPQLLNVMLGQMSLVGPRPLSIRDALGIEKAWQKRRFSVKPGLTCLWQVSGRSNLTFEQWMQLDLEYIDQWSLGLDCRILLRTIPAVLSGNGAV